MIGRFRFFFRNRKVILGIEGDCIVGSTQEYAYKVGLVNVSLNVSKFRTAQFNTKTERDGGGGGLIKTNNKIRFVC